jgi:hypothetical protein
VANRPPPYTLRIEPKSAIPKAPVTAQAVRVYENDLPLVDSAGAEVVATIDVDGDEPPDSSLAAKAAEAGGTHFTVLTAGEHQEQRVTPEAQAEADRANRSTAWNCATVTAFACARPHVQAQASTVTVHHFRVLVGRVPPERWAELPPALRPR